MAAYVSLKGLAKDDRPREKLVAKGAAALSDSEIVAILIGSGTRKKSAVELAREILRAVDNDLNKLARLTTQDLKKFKGIGEAKAITIVAALELGRRKKNGNGASIEQIRSSKDAYELMRPVYEDLNHEEFHIITLSRANKVLSVELISKGGLNATVADGKLIFKKTLAQGASGIVLTHNHPSGNAKPSTADRDLTRKLSNFGSYIDLPVLDHIIVCGETYFSFADEGLI
jgi:DNA repair protein RadC